MDRATSCLIIATTFICVALSMLALRTWRRRGSGASGHLAVIDYLVLVPVVLSVLFVLLPLLTLSSPSNAVLTVAQGSCAVSATFIAAYPFAILDQERRYRFTIDGALFFGACAFAGAGAITIFWYC